MNSMKESSLLTLQPQLDRIHGQHAVDAEMAADVAQHVDVVELGQPLGIVDHHGIVSCRSRRCRNLENTCWMPRLLFSMSSSDSNLAALIPAGGIAHARGAAAHQGDGLVARLLQPVQQHDLDERTHMKGGCRAVESDIGCHLALGRQRVQTVAGRNIGGCSRGTTGY